MADRAMVNDMGVLHLHISGDQPEAAELQKHVESMRSKNTAHDSQEVFNPAVSKAQYRAMRAAKEGHSTLGIPANVGAEMVAKTKKVSGLPEVKHRGKGNGGRNVS